MTTMPSDKNTLELISIITEFNDLHEFMKDEHLDKTLGIESRCSCCKGTRINYRITSNVY